MHLGDLAGSRFVFAFQLRNAACYQLCITADPLVSPQRLPLWEPLHTNTIIST